METGENEGKRKKRLYYSRSQLHVVTDPDRQRAVFTANCTTAVGTAGFWRATIFLLLLKDLRVEFLQKKNQFAHTYFLGEVCFGVPKCQAHRRGTAF